MISYAWMTYSFGTLTCWWHWLILFIVLAYWFCSCHDYLVHIDMSVHFVVSLVCISVDSLACILSWLSWSMLSLLYIHLDYHTSYLACVSIWMIYTYFARLLGAWLLFFCVTACIACLCGSHIYPLTSNPLVSIISFILASYFCKCKALCVLVSLTELVVRSRV